MVSILLLRNACCPVPPELVTDEAGVRVLGKHLDLTGLDGSDPQAWAIARVDIDDALRPALLTQDHFTVVLDPSTPLAWLSLIDWVTRKYPLYQDDGTLVPVQWGSTSSCPRNEEDEVPCDNVLIDMETGIPMHAQGYDGGGHITGTWGLSRLDFDGECGTVTPDTLPDLLAAVPNHCATVLLAGATVPWSSMQEWADHAGRSAYLFFLPYQPDPAAEHPSRPYPRPCTH